MGWQGVDPAQWAREQKEKLAQIKREVVFELASEMATGRKGGGFVPEDTGNLVNSVTISAQPIRVAAENTKFAKPVISIIKSLDLPDTVHLGWRAPYAHGINYGRGVVAKGTGKTIAQGGAGFAEGIAAKFPAIVARAVQKIE